MTHTAPIQVESSDEVRGPYYRHGIRSSPRTRRARFTRWACCIGSAPREGTLLAHAAHEPTSDAATAPVLVEGYQPMMSQISMTTTITRIIRRSRARNDGPVFTNFRLTIGVPQSARDHLRWSTTKQMKGPSTRRIAGRGLDAGRRRSTMARAEVSCRSGWSR